MKKKLTALIALLAAFAATVVYCRAGVIRYFYYWDSPATGMWSWSGWMNTNHTSCMAMASFSDPNQTPKILHVEAFRYRNDPQRTLEVIQNFYTTNYFASVSIGPMDPQLYHYAIARITINNGAGGQIFADCTN